MNETYKIKPLEWLKKVTEDNFLFISAYVPFGFYRLSCGIKDETDCWIVSFINREMDINEPCKSLKDGKAKAEEHWHKRIESALIKQPEES
ncbi:hypothetical protein KAR91_63840 [Candidatus Pacearchaeota archaeon]|nr:hypothetical protein [Candidatus Pacearchaeota archaeon]